MSGTAMTNFCRLTAADNQRLQVTGDAHDMMWLSVWSPLSAGGRQLSRFTLGATT